MTSSLAMRPMDHVVEEPKDFQKVKQSWEDCERQKQDLRTEMKPLVDAMKQIKNDQSPHLQILIEHMDTNTISEMAVGAWVIRRKTTKKKAYTEEFLNEHLSSEDVEKLKNEQEPATSMSITKAKTVRSDSKEETTSSGKEEKPRKRRRVD